MDNLDSEDNLLDSELWMEYCDEMEKIREEKRKAFKEDDPFTGSLEDYGLSWRDFL